MRVQAYTTSPLRPHHRPKALGAPFNLELSDIDHHSVVSVTLTMSDGSTVIYVKEDE
jgi:hypothetical protein